MKITEFYQKSCEAYIPFFRKCESWALASDKRVKLLSVLNKSTTVLAYAAYIAAVITAAFQSIGKLAAVIAVPAFVFLAVTVIRSKINAPRPYERDDISSLVHKSTKGKSCPSRHSACAFVIAAACLYVNVPMGMAMLLLAAFIAFIRPVMGVHYPLDVIFGGGIALILGGAGFFVSELLMR